MKRKSPQDVWKLIDVKGEDDCWPWTGYTTTTKDGNGYGLIGIAGGDYVAHRVVFWITNPHSIELKAPKDKTLRQFVLHRCDNRLCCNPKHLFLGNYDDNNKDAAAKGRTSKNHGVKGIKNYGSKLTEKDVSEIRWIVSKGISDSSINKKYGVCAETIRKIRLSKSYLGIDAHGF